MKNRFHIMNSTIFLAIVLFFSSFVNPAWADSNTSAEKDSLLHRLQKKITEGKKGKSGFHYFWDNGLRIDSPKRKARIKMNLVVNVDTGYIDTNRELEDAFPDLEGSETVLRRLRLLIAGTVLDNMDFKAQIEYSDDDFRIKDFWYGFNKVPYIGTFRIGHLREPFSLETLTSSQALTFMERSLPTTAFSPGRNLGITLDNTVLSERLYWSAGAFLSIAGLTDEEDFFDVLSDNAGYDLTARIVTIPWYSEEDGEVLHFGLSYSHLFRDDDDSDSQFQAKSRPESHLTDDRLVDTGKFYVDSGDAINLEIALSHGPFSLQGELFYVYTNANADADPRFWGFYVFSSFFLTGEYRQYDISKATFTPEEPTYPFRPRKGSWGAWEFAFRYSYVDLNNENIKGGKENNFTVGLNCYLGIRARVMFNYVYGQVDSRDDPLVDNGRVGIFQTRLQFIF